MRRRKFITAAGVGTTLTAGCLINTGGNSEAAIIGAAHPFSGPMAPWANAHDIGLQIAIDEANARDDTDQEFEYESVDSEASPSEAATALTRLIEQDGASLITGSVSSDVGIRSAQVAEDMEVPNLLFNSGTHAALSTDSRYTFRLGWLPAPSHVRSDLEYIQEQGHESVGAIVADYAWGRAVETSIEEFFPDDIEYHIEVAPQDAGDFTPYLRNMPDVDVMTHVGHPVGAPSITGQQAELGIDVPTLGVDAPQRTTIDALGGNLENVITRHLADMTSDEVQQLGEKVSDREGYPIYAFEPVGYIAGKLFTDAVVEVGDDPEAIADYIRENQHDVPYANPLQYTEWGELDGVSMYYSEFESEAPSYHPDGEYRLNPVFETSELPPYNPDEMPLD